jgi:hypothetical protein
MVQNYKGYEIVAKQENELWQANISDGMRTGLHTTPEAAIDEAKKWIDAKPPRRS